MNLEARLTVGWPNTGNEVTTAKYIAGRISPTESESGVPITELLPADSIIRKLDDLVRRDSSGYSDVKNLISALLCVSSSQQNSIICEIDVFSYAFLKAAKNFDFFLPAGDLDAPVRKTLMLWTRHIREIENFERIGKLPRQFTVKAVCNNSSAVTKAQVKSPEQVTNQPTETPDWCISTYQNLRNIVARPSARDELRALYTFLYSGPSTSKQLSKELSLNESLSVRIIASLQSTNAIEAAAAVQKSNRNHSDTIYQIKKRHIPIAVFLIRETLGCDLLPLVFNPHKESID